MGQMTNGKAKKGAKEDSKEKVKKEEVIVEEGEDEGQEQDGASVHSPTLSSLRKEKSDVEVDLKLLQALEIYPPAKLQGPHRHFVLYGLTEYMCKSLHRPFTADEVLKLLKRFYNLEMVKPDEEDLEFLNHEEDFRLPESFFVKEESGLGGIILHRIPMYEEGSVNRPCIRCISDPRCSDSEAGVLVLPYFWQF